MKRPISISSGIPARLVAHGVVFALVTVCGKAAFAQVPAEAHPEKVVASEVLARRIGPVESGPKDISVKRALQLLAGAGVSVGAVVSQEEVAKPVALQRGSRLAETVGDVLDSATQALPGLRVGQYGGAVVLTSPQAAACLAALRRPLGDVQLSGPAYSVINQLARLAIGEKDPFVAGGIVSGGGELPPGPRPEELTLTLNGAGFSYLEALQEMSRQIPTMGWLVQQRRAVERQADGTLSFANEPKDVCGTHLLSETSEVFIATSLDAARNR